MRITKNHLKELIKQSIFELSEADDDAAKKAKKADVCIPIGEGENCW